MQLNISSLTANLKKELYRLYVLTGQEPYLLNEAAYQIKQAWFAQSESEHQILEIQTPSDWQHLIEQANSYALFCDRTLIDVRFDKKTFDQTAKKTLTRYLQDSNPRCLILLKAPQLNSKQTQWLAAEKTSAVVSIYPLAPTAFKSWIVQHLKKHLIQFNPNVPDTLQRLTEGNMLACAQIIKQFSIILAEHEPLTEDLVCAYVGDQAHYQIYELSDACLSANLDKTIRILKHAKENRTEATLVLWVLTQDIRQLIELNQQQTSSFSQAYKPLKIWPKKIPLYQGALKRHNTQTLHSLLKKCWSVDQQIKTSGQTAQIWQEINQLALALCS